MIIIQKLSTKNCHFNHLRQTMVDSQLRPQNIFHDGLIDAFLNVPREEYVFENEKHFCYSDQMIPLKNGRYLLPPLTLAKMIQGLNLQSGQNVLVVGCNLGYSIDILNNMGLDIDVTGIDCSMFIKAAINRKSYYQRHMMIRSLSAGYFIKAPYDAILIEGGIDLMPNSLIVQLKEGGKLSALIFQKEGTPFLGTVFEKKNNDLAPIQYFESVGFKLNDICTQKKFSF